VFSVGGREHKDRTAVAARVHYFDPTLFRHRQIKKRYVWSSTACTSAGATP
jgi:hypothetical protein